MIHIQCMMMTQKLSLSSFKLTEIEYLKEYLLVMKPIATVLDKLQEENANYYGLLMLVIFSAKGHLEMRFEQKINQ